MEMDVAEFMQGFFGGLLSGAVWGRIQDMAAPTFLSADGLQVCSSIAPRVSRQSSKPVPHRHCVFSVT